MNCYKCVEPIPAGTRTVHTRIVHNNHGKTKYMPDSIEVLHVDCAESLPDITEITSEDECGTNKVFFAYGIMPEGF